MNSHTIDRREVDEHLNYLERKVTHFRRSAQLLQRMIEWHRKASSCPTKVYIDMSLDAWIKYEQHELTAPKP